MQHWTSKYIGLPYIEGQYDCGHFVEDVLATEFNVQLDLPKRIPGKLDKQIDIQKNKYYRTTAPTDGDLVLMVSRNRSNHVGVYFELDIPYVLHNMKGIGCVVSHPLNKLNTVGIKIEGFYYKP